MSRRGSARADAIRRAHEAKAARDAARQHREALIETTLADYHQAAASAQRTRDTAARKAGELLAEAEHDAAPHDQAAATAVSRLCELLGGITETAQLCGLTTTAVRDMLTATATATGTADGQPDGPAPRAGGDQP